MTPPRRVLSKASKRLEDAHKRQREILRNEALSTGKNPPPKRVLPGWVSLDEAAFGKRKKR